jgi:hypothetical protein
MGPTSGQFEALDIKKSPTGQESLINILYLEIKD